MLPKIRAIAFHLPQFHPISENDKWWGKGFTEWTNVSRARPLFVGHNQPFLPGELGFYDLRLAEAREAQAELARNSGIEGFCYWHYWFHGTRLLNRPIDEILALKSPSFPFCLAWANESWSRRWLGEDKEILIEQRYSPDDDDVHASWLATCFADHRYIKKCGRPVFLIYRPMSLPDPKSTLRKIRKACQKANVGDPYIIGINAHSRYTDMRTIGFDATEDHSPQLGVLPGAFYDGFSYRRLLENCRKLQFSGISKRYDYEASINLMEATRPEFLHHPAFFVGWDNTARRGKQAIIIEGNTASKIKTAFNIVVSKQLHRPFEDRFVFINAWNEWAEGMCLEPSASFGREALDAVKECILED